MTAYNHAFTGAVIGVALKNPALVFPVAFVSHLVLDILPHYGDERFLLGTKNFYKLIVADGITLIALVGALLIAFPALRFAILLGAFTALLPDIIWFTKYLTDRKPDWRDRTDPFTKFHARIQWYEKPAGAITEIIWPLLLLPVVLYLP